MIPQEFDLHYEIYYYEELMYNAVSVKFLSEPKYPPQSLSPFIPRPVKDVDGSLG